MKFSVGEIRKNTHKEPFAFDDQVDVSELETMNNDIRSIGSVHVSGKVDVQGDDFIFTFIIDGNVILPCARTLVDVPYPLSVSAFEVFNEFADTQEDSDSDSHPIEGDVLDLTPLIKENILLALPYRVFSDDDNVLSQAPLKGEGWELVSEEDEDSSIDPRMQKLASLLEDEDKGKK
ncbi:DUF177 domain-containing protein [Barrientosiimonas marina]|uniref:YceD family protein n=1 Tax=Lentibacillus kimchii TaxID=1542911 RepID=A0ABW2UT57_9BACI